MRVTFLMQSTSLTSLDQLEIQPSFFQPVIIMGKKNTEGKCKCKIQDVKSWFKVLPDLQIPTVTWQVILLLTTSLRSVHKKKKQCPSDSKSTSCFVSG